jgi:hypothetical protein
MLAAAGQTRDRAFDPAHARKIALTMWAFVQVPPSAFASWERQIMTALLVRDSQVAASLPPLDTMGQDASPARAELSKNMSQFMTQRAINFRRMLKQLRV